MKKVQREELLDYVTYAERRPAVQERVFTVKAPRRVHVGEYLTFLFENTETIRYQIQEMMRAEQIVREKDIAHELHTYNGLLGDEGELGCTLLIEIDDRAQRDVLLRRWVALPGHVYVKLADGRKVHATFDPAQVSEERLSAVQYLKFDTGGEVPVAVGCDLPHHPVEAALTDAQRAALAEDLAAG